MTTDLKPQDFVKGVSIIRATVGGEAVEVVAAIGFDNIDQAENALQHTATRATRATWNTRWEGTD